MGQSWNLNLGGKQVMRIAIISDVHLGDDSCQLTRFSSTQSGRNPVLGPKYEAFIAAAGRDNDILILLGDIFDFSIASYAESYAVAKVFFQQIQKDKIAKQIIYVPGNHDFDMWHFYEYDINVVRRITGGRPPHPFRFSVPAIIDARKNRSGEEISLFGVTRNSPPAPPYGNLFLDQLTKNEDGSGEVTPFLLAYPNVYLLTDQSSILLTHGHYLESYWSLVSEWALPVADSDLHCGGTLDVAELVAVNFPLNQLACSGVGQAGLLTNVVRALVKEVKAGNLERVRKYLDRLDDEIDRRTPARWLLDPAEAVRDAACHYGKAKLIEQLEKMKSSRYSEDFLHTQEVLGRFQRYFAATLLEIDYINQQPGFSIPTPRNVIFGHTHDPILWEDGDAPWTQTPGGHPLTLYNTGGWLEHKDERSNQTLPCRAAMFSFDNSRAQQMSSQIVG
jgi:predicted phosphodiesterase